jgi:sugar diacid utilization regulator
VIRQKFHAATVWVDRRKVSSVSIGLNARTTSYFYLVLERMLFMQMDHRHKREKKTFVQRPLETIERERERERELHSTVCACEYENYN